MPCFLVTGGSTGLGRATVEHLASGQRHSVVLTATRAEVAEAVAASIRERTGNRAVHGLALDLADPESIARFLSELEKRDEPLEAIAFNAGIQIVTGLQKTTEGFERTMAVNHFGHMRLLEGLFRSERIRFGDRPRLVFVGSGTHHPDEPVAKVFGFRGGNFESVQTWAEGTIDDKRTTAQQGQDRYANSKLANIMSAFEGARRFPNWTVLAYDPGLMPGTNLARDQVLPVRILWKSLLRWIAPTFPGVSTADRSARRLRDLMTAPEWADKNGAYIAYHGRPAMVTDRARDSEAAARLWNETALFLNLELPAVQQSSSG